MFTVDLNGLRLFSCRLDSLTEKLEGLGLQVGALEDGQATITASGAEVGSIAIDARTRYEPDPKPTGGKHDTAQRLAEALDGLGIKVEFEEGMYNIDANGIEHGNGNLFTATVDLDDDGTGYHIPMDDRRPESLAEQIAGSLEDLAGELLQKARYVRASAPDDCLV